MNLKDFIKGVEAELTKPESIAEEFQQITGMEHLDRLRQQALDQARRKGRIEGLREALRILNWQRGQGIRMESLGTRLVGHTDALAILGTSIEKNIEDIEALDA